MPNSPNNFGSLLEPQGLQVNKPFRHRQRDITYERSIVPLDSLAVKGLQHQADILHDPPSGGPTPATTTSTSPSVPSQISGPVVSCWMQHGGPGD